ncbi:hypothetical protein M1466_03720 [Candidatus Dependentiae bacterium]|nr:hypothetical protein [Candidatus Dependentiae bacterium]
MMNTSTQSISKRTTVGKQWSYQEVVTYLNAHWQEKFIDKSLAAIKKVDQQLGNVLQRQKTIAVAGINGKSLTINFLAQILKQENITVGALYAPHIATYNERIAYNNTSIANQPFAEHASAVLTAMHDAQVELYSGDLLLLTACHYFAQQQVDVALVEITHDTAWDPILLTKPIIAAITRVVEEGALVTQEAANALIQPYLGLFQPGCQIVSADQSKLNLQIMHDLCKDHGAVWTMPIRKLATLPYPYEQLHGRCAALAERIGQVFVQEFTNLNETAVSDSLLAKPKGLRGRPTLAMKRHAELNPKKTVDQYWKETNTTLPSRFQLLAQKPQVLLDTASNYDAFKNLLLGIRLLHYARPLKGLVIIVGCEDNNLQTTEFFKLVRYFFKKTSGNMIFCPIVKDSLSPAAVAGKQWDVEQVTNDVKNLKVKAKSAASLAEAIEAAKKLVDEQEGLIVVTGSRALVRQYLALQGTVTQA